MPILDAFGHPLKVEQIWLPKLTINNNFRDVARFDRCTTCHQAIDRTAPGSAIEPGYHEAADRLQVLLPTPTEAAEQATESSDEKSADSKASLMTVEEEIGEEAVRLAICASAACCVTIPT